MRFIMTGCEYAGTTTLSQAFGRWASEAFGGSSFAPNSFHDHWKLPCINNWSPMSPEEEARVMAERPDTRGGDFTRTGLTEEEQQQVLALSPRLKEMVQRYHLQYHLHPSFYKQPDNNLVGAHIEEGVYAPIYFGYGGPGQKGDRSMMMREFEHQVLELAPDTVLVLVTASSEEIRNRMRENPHHNGVLQEQDVEYVLRRFNEEYEASLLRNKITIDTSSATVEESVTELVDKMQPFLSDADRARMKG